MSSVLSGRTAIVTGAASGIGYATAKRFVAEGARVLAVDIAAEGLARLAAECPDVLTLVADVALADGVDAIFARVAENFDRLDILVNNAGAPGPLKLRLHDVPLKDFDRVIAVNTRALFATIQRAVPLMMAQGKGAIVNVVSTSAYHSVLYASPYAISKAAAAMLTRQAAVEYAADGIRVNGVAPGLTRTPMLDGVTEERMAFYAAGIPQRRMAEPEEMSDAILYLASDQSSYVNGAVIVVDGAGLA